MGPENTPSKKQLAPETETRDSTAPGGRGEMDVAMRTYEGWGPRKEVFTPVAELLTFIKNINIGCWNVRTVCQAGILAQVPHENAPT